jgi:hypothetical protein
MTYRRLEAKYEEAQARWLAGITPFTGKHLSLCARLLRQRER